MYTLTTIVIFCLAVITHGLPDPRIVGGENASNGKYPYIVSLKRYDEHFCGGSILNNRFILTAAHCVAGFKAREFTIQAGTNNLFSRGDVYKVEQFIFHEKYDSISHIHDIGLVIVSKNITFTDKVKPVKLSSTYGSAVKKNVTAIGWGRLGADLPSPNFLQEIQLTTLPILDCKRVLPHVERTNICTFVKPGRGVCEGDSGGPLMANGVQIGLVSHGVPCAVDYPDVFTRVFSYRKWIDSYMGNYEFKDENVAGHASASFCMIVVGATILQFLR